MFFEKDGTLVEDGPEGADPEALRLLPLTRARLPVLVRVLEAVR